jgi:hypothetical protein
MLPGLGVRAERVRCNSENMYNRREEEIAFSVMV